MDVEIIASEVSDNYFYLLSEGTEALLIDPVDGAKAIESVLKRHLQLESVVNTHFHPDHIGGNDEILTRFPDAELLVAAGDRQKIANQQPQFADDMVSLDAGDEIGVGDADIQILHTPGHTPGHISLLHDEQLFSGDTIFVGGAGNCSFGGDSGTLFQTFRDTLRKLSPDTVFYPGHDYSVRNIEFILSIEPDNEQARQVLEAATQHQNDGSEPFMTTLGKERQYNPFMRFDDSHLRDQLSAEHGDLLEEHRSKSNSDNEAVFRTVRSLRNRW